MTRIFRQFFEPETCTYTYLIGTKSKEALIIDPVYEKFDLYTQIIKELDLALCFVIDTHTHADHITCAYKLHKNLGAQIINGEQSLCENVHIKLKENESIKINNQTLKAIYTPGHTDDSYSYHFEKQIFTGDILLIRGTGRTDFQNGDSKKSYDSIFNKLLKLPDETLVYPAHDYNGRTVSTIYEEKFFNPRLQVNSIEDYCKIMDNLNLPYPKYIDQAVPANLKAGKIEKN
jgi:sulfur dioxygenase